MFVVLKWLLVLIAAGAITVLLAAQFGALKGQMPPELGVREGKLARPSKNPNSVSSQADLWPDHPQREYARIAPLALIGNDGRATLARLKALCEATPGARVIKAEADYLYVQFETRLMKYTDDAEFWFDPATGVIQVRSASRLGRKDFGVNRARIESLRARLAG